ncbi:MAG: DUF2135 domain-containing protein [Chitinophagaceae bacterium]|nr:MAG: DUF2135 domain-containing protein [Chitinophagaceae bacterium]
MRRILLICLCIWICTPSCVEVAKKVQKAQSTGIPVLKVAGDTSGKALQIQRLLINVEVTGNIATTTFDITFYNDRNELLEGEFDFPLADGQSISRYALDVNDKLREGVVVEKAKARVAFENTARRKIDPGLVEKTAGNHFRTRIYPIPAKGYKRVVIGVDQVLQASDGDLRYELPLYTNYPIERFTIDATVALPAEKPVLAKTSWSDLQFSKEAAWQASMERNQFQPADVFGFTIPLPGDAPLVYTGTHGGKPYFYAYLPGDAAARSKPLPKSISVYWDISSSAASRNIEKETALLKEYISAIKDVTVTVVPFDIQTHAASTFRITGGNTKALEDFLHGNKEFDGGTQLGALDFNRKQSDEILLFTDGISTFGKKEIVLSRTPVTVVTSSPGADFSYLKYIARQTNGRFADLTSTDPKEVAPQLLKEVRHFLKAEFAEADIDEWTTSIQTGMQDGFAMSGVLKGNAATVTLHFGYGSTTTEKKTIRIEKASNTNRNIARIWANMRINELDLQYEKNKAAITVLGKQFSIVTRNTSLLVLDRVEDYVEHEIEPPAELRKEYRALLEEKNRTRKDEKLLAHNDAERAMQELVNWWNTPVQPKTATMPAVDSIASGVSTYSLSTDSTVVTTTSSEALPPPSGTYNYSANAPIQEMRLEGVTADAIAVTDTDEPSAPEPVIEVKAWKADAPYLSELEKVAPGARFQKYRELKKTYAAQPSFYIEVARFFFEKKDLAIALQVLSNVTELKLESPELLRIVADQLMEFDQKELAIATYREVLNLREEEPHAYRDLALAYNESGNYNEAVKLLQQVATGVWDGRFGDIRQIALLEMNAIISAHPGAVDCAEINPEFIKAMPVDVRIVIGWSADNSDVDLWVTDPGREKCSYENTHTAVGGRISKDATQGYGPEEYLLKKAVDGSYEIEVNLFGDRRETLGGPITIKAELFTNFGKPTQQRKVLSVRVKENKEVVKIGKLVFG